MSFNKRSISDEKVLESYHKEGVSAVWKLYTKGADALILSGTLAKECHKLICTDNRVELEETLKNWDR
jgi:hypothetical protein